MLFFNSVVDVIVMRAWRTAPNDAPSTLRRGVGIHTFTRSRSRSARQDAKHKWFDKSSQVKPEISAHSRPRTGPLGVTSA